MYNNLDNDYLLKDIFNLEKKAEEVLNPKEGLRIGNLFYNLYQPYKHYEPRELVARDEKEVIMLKIQELSFAINDLVLYLDLNPNNEEMIHLFRQCSTELKRVCEIYVEKYGPLLIEEDLKDGFNWYKGPWPWEGKDV